MKIVTLIHFYYTIIFEGIKKVNKMFNEIKTHEITVDIVILTIKDDALQALLVKRNN